MNECINMHTHSQVQTNSDNLISSDFSSPPFGSGSPVSEDP